MPKETIESTFGLKRFGKNGGAATAVGAPGTEPGSAQYACPMHPVLRYGLGSCPVCGMNLLPRTG